MSKWRGLIRKEKEINFKGPREIGSSQVKISLEEMCIIHLEQKVQAIYMANSQEDKWNY